MLSICPWLDVGKYGVVGWQIGLWLFTGCGWVGLWLFPGCGWVEIWIFRVDIVFWSSLFLSSKSTICDLQAASCFSRSDITKSSVGFFFLLSLFLADTSVFLFGLDWGSVAGPLGPGAKPAAAPLVANEVEPTIAVCGIATGGVAPGSSVFAATVVGGG